MKNIEQSIDLSKATRHSFADIHPYDYLKKRQELQLLERPDSKESVLVIAPEKDPGFFYVIEFENDRLTPIFFAYKNWYEQKFNQIEPEFKAIYDEISEWLVHRTKINPNLGGFVDWFIQSKVGQVLYLHQELVIDEATNVPSVKWKIMARFDDLLNPTVFERHLQEYCQFKTEILNNYYEEVDVPTVYTTTPAPAPSPSDTPTILQTEPTYSVYDVAAMCYYLERARFNKFTSRAKFIKDELIPNYKFTLASITNKCSNMEKFETRRKRQGAIKNAILIMQNTEKFNFEAAILLAESDLAGIEDNRQ